MKGPEKAMPLTVMNAHSTELEADAVAVHLSDSSPTFEGIGKDRGVSGGDLA